MLNSLVVTEKVIPLPILRATYLLKNAEKLTKKSHRDKKTNTKLNKFIEEARYQLEMAELLGYGTKEKFSPIYNQIDIIENKIKNKHSGSGWFDNLKEKITNLVK